MNSCDNFVQIHRIPFTGFLTPHFN